MGNRKRADLVAFVRDHQRVENPSRLVEPTPAVRRCEGPDCGKVLVPKPGGKGGKKLRAWTRFCCDACRSARWQYDQAAKRRGAVVR